MKKTNLVLGMENCGPRVVYIQFSPVNKYVLGIKLFA